MLRTAVAQNLPSNMADMATIVKRAQSMQPLYSMYLHHIFNLNYRPISITSLAWPDHFRAGLPALQGSGTVHEPKNF